jgi:hypothetical protein
LATAQHSGNGLIRVNRIFPRPLYLLTIPPIVESSYYDDSLEQILNGNFEEAFDNVADSLEESVKVDLTDANAIKKLVLGEKASAIISLSRSMHSATYLTCCLFYHTSSTNLMLASPSIIAWQRMLTPTPTPHTHVCLTWQKRLAHSGAPVGSGKQPARLLT